MKLTIDNQDGLGAVDYYGAVSTAGRVKVERVLNAPSRCRFTLLPNAALATPVRRARVMVTAESGVVLFTGYIPAEPVREFVGAGVRGNVYHLAVEAISDEWLLDRQVLPESGAGIRQAAGQMLRTLTSRVDSAGFTSAGVTDAASVGVFEPNATETWSANAGRLAGAGYASYRVVNGALSLQTAGTVTHALNDGDGSLHVAGLKSSAIKELANDVTLSGELEPAAYVTEMFGGDGTTSVFTLGVPPFRPKRRRLLVENFNQGQFDRRVWQVVDPGSHLGFGAAGLVLSGGNGTDGQTTLTAVDGLELGGTLVVEAGAVQLGAGCAGVVCGLYQGATAQANCFAGFNVRQGGGNTVVVPMVNGAEVGSAFTLLSNHAYTLRLRLHSAEVQRVRQTYYAMVDGVVQAFGGGLVAAPVAVVFEVQDLGASSNSPAVVLYDGTVADSPASCSFVAVNSAQLFGSAGFFRVLQTGSVWVVSTASSGIKRTRLVGAAGEGADCRLSSTGKVTFFSGRVPIAGEFVTILYRTVQRPVARLQDLASVAREGAGGTPGTAAWRGRVISPPARSSVDCESAAAAVLALSVSRSAALAGRYEARNPRLTNGDVWPGDVLALTTGSDAVSAVVRVVAIEDGGTRPETLTYRTAFANDWAEALGLRLSEKIAADVSLPQTALSAPGMVLANLQQMQVVSATGTALQVDAGTAPPVGGGFEVRGRDGGFGPGVGPDLVLRSPARSFAIPRAAQVERYYVRMYDASTPPLYSRLSSAVFTDLPVG